MILPKWNTKFNPNVNEKTRSQIILFSYVLYMKDISIPKTLYKQIHKS